MGLNKIREDSIAGLHARKSVEELFAENLKLKEQVNAVVAQLTDTQAALCDVYELIAGGGKNG